MLSVKDFVMLTTVILVASQRCGADLQGPDVCVVA